MARCTPYHAVGCTAITFFLLGLVVPFLSLTVWANDYGYAGNYEYYLTKNSPSMIWYDCIDVITKDQPYPGASNAYLLYSIPPISGSEPFDFTAPIKPSSHVMYMHLLQGSQVNITFQFTTTVSVYFVQGQNAYNNFLTCYNNCPPPSVTGINGSASFPITSSDEYWWFFEANVNSYSGSVHFTGFKTLYQIDESNVMTSASVSNSGLLCVPWSSRTSSFYILVQGPQDDSIDAWLYYYSYDLIWTRRWSFIAPLMAGIFILIGLLIPGILFFIMVKWLRPRYLEEEIPTEYASYAAPNASYSTAAPTYVQPPSYGQYQQAYTGGQAPYTGQPAYQSSFTGQSYGNNPPKY